MVNETFARRFFGTANAVGRRLGGGGTSRSAPLTIIGVVHNLRRAGPGSDGDSKYYSPWVARNVDIIVRTDGDPIGLATTVRAAIHAVQPRAAIERVGRFRWGLWRHERAAAQAVGADGVRGAGRADVRGRHLWSHELCRLPSDA